MNSCPSIRSFRQDQLFLCGNAQTVFFAIERQDGLPRTTHQSTDINGRALHAIRIPYEVCCLGSILAGRHPVCRNDLCLSLCHRYFFIILISKYL